MKKYFCLLVFALLLLGSKPAFAYRFFVEGKLGYFRPYSELLRDLYSRGWVDYQIEASYSPFDSRNCGWWRNFFLWNSYNFIYNHGETKSGFEDSEIDVQIYTFGAGLKYLLPLPNHFGVYASAGPRFILLRIENRDPEVDPRDRAHGLGGVCGVGLLFNPYKWLLVDFYSNVMTKHFNADHFIHSNEDTVEKSVTISGVTFGVGLGISF